MPSNSSLIIAAAGSAALLLAASVMKGPTTDTETENLDPEDCIQPDDVCAVFDDLFLHMQSVLAQLSQQIQQIQMAGQSIPEAQLRQLLKSEFERALASKQRDIFEKHDVDEDCLKEATWEFLEKEEEHPKVKKAVERFQMLYENVTGEKVVGRRPGGKAPENAVVQVISKVKLLECATVYFDALTNAMGNIVKKYKAEGKNFRDPMVAQTLQMEFASVANDAGESALEKEGVTLNEFKAAVEKYQSDPEVGRSLHMLQMKQQRELSELGVPTM